MNGKVGWEPKIFDSNLPTVVGQSSDWQRKPYHLVNMSSKQYGGKRQHSPEPHPTEVDKDDCITGCYSFSALYDTVVWTCFAASAV